MKQKSSMSRREFLLTVAAATGGLALTSLGRAFAQAEGHPVYLPLLMKQGNSSPHSLASARVVHIHNPSATTWNGSPAEYWNYVNQEAVDSMVDQGVMSLTGMGSLVEAWRALLPSYQPGQGIAIKVSFSNTNTCTQNSGYIDSVIEPVNAVIRGLKAMGVSEPDIWIYETIRALPNRFVNGCDYPNVTFYDNGSCGRNRATFVSSDPNAAVQFYTPAGGPTLAPHRITDVLINATYLINIPIMKMHTSAGTSLAFKNHYGTTVKPTALHVYSSLASPSYTPNYSPLVDIYRNPHISGKTVLTIGDGLFASLHNARGPRTWVSFGNQVPKSLFFSLDPVAMDCVMLDLLTEEFVQNTLVGNIDPRSDDYLVLAQTAGFGTFERGNPWMTPSTSGYDFIDYQKIELSPSGTPVPTSAPSSTSLPPSATATAAATALASATATSTRTSTPTPTATAAHAGTSTSSPPPPTGTRVVHVHNPNATTWNGSPTEYWNYVNQGAVDSMVDQGVMTLTGMGSLAAAWRALLPNYQPGQGIAIKVSFNNTDACTQNSGYIDSVIEPVNAVIRGLKAMGVSEPDIWIYETIRALPTRFTGGCDYPNVTLFDNGTCGHNRATFVSSDPNAAVQFYTPPGGPTLAPHRITDVLINATYLINIPIMKMHTMAGTSLAFKNHYGSTVKPTALHVYSSLASPSYTPNYSPLVDIYRNPHISGKTVLTIGDGIFASFSHTRGPRTWVTFGNQVPKSMFFSLDPVAIDCVMLDLLTAEFAQNTTIGDIDPRSDDYLVLAQSAGFGTFERGNPWATPAGSGYDFIDYQKIEL